MYLNYCLTFHTNVISTSKKYIYIQQSNQQLPILYTFTRVLNVLNCIIIYTKIYISAFQMRSVINFIEIIVSIGKRAFIESNELLYLYRREL